MSNELIDILSNSNKDIDNQKLMDYLSNHLSKENIHELEKIMAEDDFMNDAVEGLQKFKRKEDMQACVEQLNRDLQKQITKNKKRKLSRKFKDQPYTYITVIIILLLLVISFVVLKKYLDAKKVIHPTTTAQVIAIN